MTGIFAESAGGFFCRPGSTFSGGLITPPDWFSRSLKFPEGPASVEGCLSLCVGDPGGSAARVAGSVARKDPATIAIAPTRDFQAVRNRARGTVDDFAINLLPPTNSLPQGRAISAQFLKTPRAVWKFRGPPLLRVDCEQTVGMPLQELRGKCRV
jgi:hypothetical protein